MKPNFIYPLGLGCALLSTGYAASNLPESPAYQEYVHAAGKMCGQIARHIDQSAPVTR